MLGKITVYVKIIASIGPASSNPSIVERMVLLGVNGFRINFAHGDPSAWKKYVDTIREVENKTGTPLTIIGDLVGPSIRLGILEEPVLLNPEDRATIIYAEKSAGGDSKEIPLPLKRFFEVIDDGDVLVMDDGRIQLRVIRVEGVRAVVEALTPAKITSRKAIVVRGKEVDLPTLTQRDLEALSFAVSEGLDYIALSYVRSPRDLKVLKNLIREKGGDQHVAAKIETKSAIENLPQIVDEADLVVVARGDLGMNYGLEEIPLLQERIVEQSRRLGKPVIVATQVLESMVENPSPTRAEITDIYVAVSQGVDAIMLTGETSIGKYPIEAIRWLKRVLRRAEETISVKRYKPVEERWAYANSIVETAETMGAKAILIYSMHGTLPPKLATSRPKVRVVVGTNSAKIARRISLLWGLETLIIPAHSYEEGLRKLEEELCKRDELSIGDIVVKAYRLENENRMIIASLMECKK
ncbi:pyruvate kinase [Pyrofollis japonicus]|uniref:pyruvate kinase n=1 Tax=Pyrofollis japonicus TaxID=3060460 RepID=UPI00295A5985|nr:pyruvate kinase [Pyrofollis japonicus]BEP18538.1 pyruvate kinase [Pyrofollis japonicus]